MLSHPLRIYLGEPDEDLIESLEPDQLVVEMDKPVARMQLSGRAIAGLWALRIFLLTITLGWSSTRSLPA